MTIVNETTHAGEGIFSELPGTQSRENVTIASGQDLAAMAVIGRVRGAVGAPSAYSGNTGDGTFAATPTALINAKEGTYNLVIVEPATNAGTFVLFGPDGTIVGVGNVASAYSGPELSFTLQDGATDFVAGDGFTITIAAGTEYGEYDNADTTGLEIAAGVLLAAVDASAAAAPGVAIVRGAEIKNSSLVWESGQSAGDKTAAIADLAALGILTRDSI